MAEPTATAALWEAAKNLMVAMLIAISGWLGRDRYHSYKEGQKRNRRVTDEDDDIDEDCDETDAQTMQRHAAIHKHIGTIRKEFDDKERKLLKDHEGFKNTDQRIEAKVDANHQVLQSNQQMLLKHLEEVGKSMERLLRAEFQLEAVMREQGEMKRDHKEFQKAAMDAVEKVRKSVEDLKDTMRGAFEGENGRS